MGTQRAKVPLTNINSLNLSTNFAQLQLKTLSKSLHSLFLLFELFLRKKENLSCLRNKFETMSIPILAACQKRKRRPKLFRFQTFADRGCPIDPKGAFRDNIRVFLQECAELHEDNVQGMPTWCTLLVHEARNFVVPLYTIEEEVICSPRPYCDHCRCTG